MTNQLQSLEQIKATLIDLAIRYGPKVLVALAILTAGFFVARSVGTFFGRSLQKAPLEPPVRNLIIRFIRVVVLMLFVVLALTNLEINLLPLIAGLSVVGAGVALAMQGVLGNLAAGLVLLFTRPFRVGEYIALLGVEGEVTDIELFTTALVHADLSRVIIPNRKIVGEVLHNYGKLRQHDLTVGVAYGGNLEEALGLVRDLLAKDSRVLKAPAPQIGVAELGDSAIQLSIRPWTTVHDFVATRPALLRAIAEEFAERGIEIPFPQREVTVRNAATLRSENATTVVSGIARQTSRVEGASERNA